MLAKNPKIIYNDRTILVVWEVSQKRKSEKPCYYIAYLMGNGEQHAYILGNESCFSLAKIPK